MLKQKSRSSNVVSSSVNPTASPRILGVAQVAELLGVPESSVYEYTRFRGSHNPNPLPARRVGRYLKFVESEVLTWFNNLPQVKHDRKRAYHKKAA